MTGGVTPLGNGLEVSPRTSTWSGFGTDSRGNTTGVYYTASLTVVLDVTNTTTTSVAARVDPSLVQVSDDTGRTYSVGDYVTNRQQQDIAPNRSASFEVRLAQQLSAGASRLTLRASGLLGARDVVLTVPTR